MDPETDTGSWHRASSRSERQFRASSRSERQFGASSRSERALERLAAPCTRLDRVGHCAPDTSARRRSLPSEPGVASGIEANPSACYMTQSYHEECG